MEIYPVVLAKFLVIETILLIVVVVDILVTTLTTKMQFLMLITLRLPISALPMTITDMTSSMLVMDKPSYFLVKDQVSKKILLLARPHTHEQNGVAERKIHHLVDTSLALLAHANLPLRTPCVYLGPSPSHSASQAPKDSSNFSWLHIKSVSPSSTGYVGNSGQTSTRSNIPLFSTTDQSSNNSLLLAQSPSLTTPPFFHSPIPQQSPSSDSTTDPPLSLIVDLTHYPAQLNAVSSTSTSPPRIHPMQLCSSTMQKQHACLSTKAKNYLIP
ncbi:hypothetical protein CK203_029062 [Vitis vinifera]|uniref:Uncharacterized protein n=1 Tax=Vitis vinifera TaxID=29760 RepID=A0A438IN36_VITVI|nr:hypothetical protein CK203_029062 [Vitis vinifera]